MGSVKVVLTLVVVMCCVLMKSSSALIHVVGGSKGWEIPPNSSFYAHWAKSHIFHVHDKLVFPYRIGKQNVIQVSKEDFEKCGKNHIIKVYYKGPTVIKLNTTGDYYFYSGIATHCKMGQKLHLTVVPPHHPNL